MEHLFMARREGLEPPANCLEGSCSILLSYRRRLPKLYHPTRLVSSIFWAFLSSPPNTSVAALASTASFNFLFFAID